MILNIFKDLSHLFFPNLCVCCGQELFNPTYKICLHCRVKLPHTGFASIPDNPIEKIFCGRIPLLFAHSEFYFTQKGMVQQMIHQLKYRNNKDIGVFMGEQLGDSLLHSGRSTEFDYIVPVPMHPKKMHKRGYNQAEVIGEGVGNVTQIPVLSNIVIRNKLTETQTRKKRTERIKNVEDSFVIQEPQALYNKKILLLDDVITTGATLEACGQNILEVQGTELGIISVAYANK